MRDSPEGRREPAPRDDPNDAVDEAVEESFPASDPPSWEPLHSGTPEPPGAGSGDAEPDGARPGRDAAGNPRQARAR